MQDRVRILNDCPLRPQAEYVLYWAQANRRVGMNHGLAYAIDLANQLDLPVVYYEGLMPTYEQANDRLHTFVLEGVPDTAAALREQGIGYVFHLQRFRAGPKNALYLMAERAAAIVTDDYPVFVAAQHNVRVSAKVEIPYHVVDSSVVIPMNRFTKREYAAYTIRPKVKKILPEYLQPFTMPRVRRVCQAEWPELHTEVRREQIPALVAECEIDHSVPPSLTFTGGAAAAERQLAHFLEEKFHRYAQGRNEPSQRATSDMSPYLHFGHISSLRLALAVRNYAAEKGMIADEYLEELIVRRELAFNYARFVEKPDCLGNLPNWARETLRKHAGDKRSPVYSAEQMEQAATHDDLWNACQQELLLRGKVHGYYRMYWGKKVLEWSPTCQDALERLIYWHDRYALDGRDPNTYTNILWLFGMNDRPWQERPIFGMVRYMSYDGMKRKTDIGAYIKEMESLRLTRQDPYRIA